MKKAILIFSIFCFFSAIIEVQVFAQVVQKPPPQQTRHRPETKLKSLYDLHQWFQLRDAVQATSPSAFYVGAVAAVFNDFAGAEKPLLETASSRKPIAQSLEARELLTNLYLRAGRYQAALKQVEAMLAAKPKSANLQNARAFFATLSQAPEQVVRARKESQLTSSIKDGNLFIPLSVNGKSAQYIVDTGANFSAMSESEAKRLGLTILSGSVKGDDATGGKVDFRVAVADQLMVGNIHLQNVLFLLARDENQPFVDLPEGERGVLGLPVLLAFETMRWRPDDNFEIGFASSPQTLNRAHLCFEGLTPVIQVGVGNRWINMVLDTGASKTDLWPRFARDFASLVRTSGKQDSRRVTGVGNSKTVKALTLPQLTLQISQANTVMRPAYILLENVGGDSKWFHGRLGLDVLRQGKSVTLDFKSMQMTLE